MMDINWRSKASPAEQLSLAHKILQWGFGDPHDAFLIVLEQAQPESMHCLMTGLRRQEHTASGGVMVCTKGHCLEALRRITNHDLGSNYEDWIDWWRANRRKTHDDWVIDGFAADGLPVTRPADDKFACALIEVLGGSKRSSWNSWFILSRVPAGQFDACIARCMRAGSIQARQGAAEALARLNTPDSRSRLHTMLTDTDAGVREQALTQLNGLLRKVNQLQADDCVLWKGRLAQHISVVAAGPFPDTLLVAAESKDASRLSLFDLASRQITWDFRCEGVVIPVPQVRHDRIYFTCDSGMVYCIDAATGERVWQQRTGGYSATRPHSSVVLTEDALSVTGENGLWSLRCSDGRVLWKLDGDWIPRGIAQSRGFLYGITPLELLKIAPEWQRRTSQGHRTGCDWPDRPGGHPLHSRWGLEESSSGIGIAGGYACESLGAPSRRLLH